LLENIFIMRKTVLFGLLLAGVTTVAQNIFREDFSTFNTGVQLNGQGAWTNNTANGGTGSCTGAGCNNAQVLNQAISYTGYGSSANSIALTPNTDGCGRLFGTTHTTGDLYVGMVINISNAQTTPVDFFRVLNSGAFTTSFRMLVQPTSGSTFNIGIRKGDSTNPTVYTANSYNYGTNYLIILKYTQGPDSNDDTVILHANPNYLAGENSNTVSATNFAGNDVAGSIDRLVIRQNAGPAGMPTGRVGLISVANTWADLTFNLSNKQFTKETFTVVSTNATRGLLSIKSNLSSENIILNIYDIQGRKVANQVISLEETINDISINPIKNTGIYVLELISENNERFTQKIIVK
jgi:hypothetical protein